jgi:hypothetical protein
MGDDVWFVVEEENRHDLISPARPPTRHPPVPEDSINLFYSPCSRVSRIDHAKSEA